jgi:hypothetical protein
LFTARDTALIGRVAARRGITGIDAGVVGAFAFALTGLHQGSHAAGESRYYQSQSHHYGGYKVSQSFFHRIDSSLEWVFTP